MPSNIQEFLTVVKLNNDEAKNKIKELSRETENWIKKREELMKMPGTKEQVRELTRLIKANEREVNKLERQTSNLATTLGNMKSVSLKELLAAEKMLNAEMKKTPQNSEYFSELTAKLSEVKTQIAAVRDQTKSQFAEQQLLNNEMETMQRVLANIDTSSIKELTVAEQALKREMQEATPHSAAYNQAAENLKKVQLRARELNNEQKEIVRTIDRYDQEIKQAQKDMATVQRETQLVNATLRNLDGSSVRDIEYSVKILNENLRNTPRGTAEYKRMTEQLKQLKAELNAVNGEQRESESTWSRMANSFNKNWAMMASGIATLTGISMTARRCVEDFAGMEEAMADTRKYTGLADEQVRELNEDLKKMDTRLPREELNELAGSAGRLGITAKDKILEFVDAAEKIKVALGDDLGEEAIDQVGKLAMAFGEDDRLGLRGAMLATGSAINELAQNSAAKAGYLVDFTARVGAFGKQLGLTQAQIMGFGAVMDENLLREEMSATAFGNMLTRMQKDTATFARIAGKSVKEFTDLLNNDANAAILALADNMKRQDPQTMMKMLDDMNLDGSRAVGVLTAMADKIDDVRKHQQLATEAYAEGNSVIGEANIMNNTAQALLDKAKNRFHELSVELGQKLLPVARYTVTTGGALVKVMSILVTFISRHIALLTTLTFVLARHRLAVMASNAALNAGIILERAWVAIAATTRSALLALNLAWILCTKGVHAYTVALRAATIAGMKNPWGALATVILTVGVAVYELTRAFKSNSIEAAKASQATREFTAQQRAMQEVNREADASVAEQVTKFKQLRKTVEDNNAKLEDRKKALAEIKAIVPEYHGQLSSEGRLINNNTAALDGYINNLIRAARARAAFNKMVAIQENSLGHEQLLENRRGNRQMALNRLGRMGIQEGQRVVTIAGQGGLLGPGRKYHVVDNQGKVIREITEETYKQAKHYQDLVDFNDRRIKQEQQVLDMNAKTSEKLEEMVKSDEKLATPGAAGSGSYSSGSGKTGKTGSSGNTTNKEETERKQKMKKEIDDQKSLTDQLLALNTIQYQKGEISYREYIDEQHRITIDGLKSQQEIYQRYGDTHKQLEAKMAEESMKAQDDANKFKLDDLERAYRQQQLTIEAAAQDQNSYLYQNERAVDDLLFAAEMEYMQRKLNLTRQGSEERAALEFEIREKQAQRQLQMRQQWDELERQYREQYLTTSNADLERIALEGLDELHQRGLLSQEEYEQARLGIIAQYAQNENTLRNEQFDKNVSAAIQRARANATGGYDKSQGLSLSNNPIMGTINEYRSMMQQLQQMRENDEISHREYEQAKAQVTSEFLQQTVATVQTGYDSINNIMQAASAYSAACAQLETTQIQKEYDRKIEAAGNNSKKRERLERERDKKIAAAKTKQNKKAMKIELAQAFASTAMAAINAYASASKVSWILGPIAAAMATAAGMMQIATIKKQHQAEEAGYYEGGFTGGSDYRRRAGIVHEGEFVANHQAVNNANLAPLFTMLDRAQQNNTVGSLTATDISRELGRGSAAVVAPVVNVNTDNEAVNATLNQLSETIANLQQQLANGIEAYSVIDGPNGSYRKTKEYEKLIK